LRPRIDSVVVRKVGVMELACWAFSHDSTLRYLNTAEVRCIGCLFEMVVIEGAAFFSARWTINDGKYRKRASYRGWDEF
jgi:hypothetical protein